MKIKFFGVVSDGCGKFEKENPIPNSIPELDKFDEWPRLFAQGTFNIKINKDRIQPAEGFDLISKGVKCLDLHPGFKPAAYLKHTAIPSNTITPEKKGKNAGDLQYWRAILQVPSKNVAHKCYMLRRVRSGYDYVIELVSGVKIRSNLGLDNGDEVELSVLSEA